MANRVLRDWTTSEPMDFLSAEAERFFTRLIMKADDYGSFYSNPKLLKGALFPLKEITPQQVGAWVFECIEAGLIFPYEVDGKEYIRIKNFKQRLRNMKNFFPHPIEKNNHLPAARPSVDGQLTVNGRLETETETETETEPAAAPLSVNVPRGRFEIDSYTSGKEAFEEIQSNEILIERLMRVVRNEGYVACDGVTVMRAVRQFIATEEAKPDFTKRPRDDIKKHLVNWIKSKAKTLNQYAAGTG